MVLEADRIRLSDEERRLDASLLSEKVYRKLPAWWGIVLLEWGAHSVLELPPDSTRDIDLQRGDQIVIQ